VLLCSPAVQHLLLAWLAWRFAIFDADAGSGPVRQSPEAEVEAATGQQAESVEDREIFDFRHRIGEPRLAVRRLRRWHEAISRAARAFETLDDEAIHALRKRIKRQRYASEFFSPVLNKGELSRYLKRLAVAQDRMGELNDLFVARERYQVLVAEDPAAWFAIGWLAARIAEVKQLASRALARLAQADSPGR
jgi:triphosphatase